MDVGTAYNWLNFLAKKFLSGAIKPDDFNTCLNAVNIDFFALKVGLPQEYKPGQPFPRQAYEVTIKITDDIKHLRTRQDINIDPITGKFLLPTNPAYGAFSSMRYPRILAGSNIPKWPEIKVLTDQDYNTRVNSALTPPSLKKPIGEYVDGGWEVLPADIQLIRLTYLRFPSTPFRNYTVNANDEDVYNPIGSTQLDWPVTVHNDFLMAIAKYWGINLNKEELWTFIKERQAAGQ